MLQVPSEFTHVTKWNALIGGDVVVEMAVAAPQHHAHISIIYSIYTTARVLHIYIAPLIPIHIYTFYD